MTETYSLTVINDSELPNPTFVVFAAVPNQSPYDSLATAWLTHQIDRNNQYVFTWDMEWGFAWAARGTADDIQWTGSGSLPADPSSDRGCRAELSYNGDFRLTPAMGTPTGDTLSIDDDATVPSPSQQPSSVAITLAGSPVYATNAGPNLHQVFTLHPTYYIDAGEYVQGRMVDGSRVTGFQRLEFSDGNTALTATLQADETWRIEPSRRDAAAPLG